MRDICYDIGKWMTLFSWRGLSHYQINFVRTRDRSLNILGNTPQYISVTLETMNSTNRRLKMNQQNSFKIMFYVSISNV